MKRAAPLLLMLMLASLCAWSAQARAQEPYQPSAQQRCLLESYPDQLCGATATEVLWCDGHRTPWPSQPSQPQSYAWLLDHASLRDQMHTPYLPGRSYPLPPLNHDPGRVRHEAFFRKMYGDSARQVRQHLAPVTWLPGYSGKALQVTTINGVDKKLQRVSEELLKLPPEILRKVARPSGTFHWRAIKGTERLSMHSFAIAIDIGVDNSDYWRWARPDAEGHLTYRNRIPLEVVEVFERHGFIWGGKWYHFDTMHFEYRPELLHPLCRAGGS